MTEKLFVIMEIKETSVSKDKIINPEIELYYPVNRMPDEDMWLHPSRIIPASELVYDYEITKGNMIFTVDQGWKIPSFNRYHERFLVRCLKKELSPIDQWLSEAPSGVCDEVKEWIKRKPLSGGKDA